MKSLFPFVKLQESAANFLTNAVFDPQSKIPEYKVCAVRIENPSRPLALAPRSPAHGPAGRHAPREGLGQAGPPSKLLWRYRHTDSTT